MAEISTAPAKYTNEDRWRYGGDFRVREALTMADGTLSPGRPVNYRSLVPTDPGSVINKSNPALECAITAVELSNYPAANTQRLQLMDMGYRYCSFDEWDLAPRYREIWEKSGDGKIVSNAGGGFALALVWCPRNLVDERHKEFLYWSDEVEKTYEDKIAETVDKFNVATGQNQLRQRYAEAIERHVESQDKLSRNTRR